MPTIQEVRQKYPQYSDMSDEQLASSLHAKYYSDLPPEQFYSKIGMKAEPQSQFDVRKKQFTDAMAAGKSGEINPVSAVYQMGSTFGGGVGDVIGNSLSLVEKAADTVMPIQGKIRNKIGEVVATAAAPLMEKAASSYNEFSENHPEAAGNIEATGRYLNFFPGSVAAKPAIKAVGPATKEMLKTTGKAGTALEKSGENLIKRKRGEFLQDLLTPKETAAVKADQFTKSKEKGILRTRVVEPSPQDIEMIGTVEKLPVSKNNSLLKNYTIISTENKKEAGKLATYLKKNDVDIKDDDILNSFTRIQDELAESPFITGDGETAAKRVIDGALKAIQDQPRTASGLLQARKDFDQWVMKLKGEKGFNPTLDSPATIAIQKTRQAMNDILDQAIPDAGVKESLRKQSLLYRAMDNIETKGGNEAKNMLTRLAQKAVDSVPGKTLLAKGALGSLGLGAFALSPVTVGAGAAAYGAGKALTGPTMRKAVGKTLKKAGKLAE